MAGTSPWDTMSLMQAAGGSALATGFLGPAAAAILWAFACTLFALA